MPKNKKRKQTSHSSIDSAESDTCVTPSNNTGNTCSTGAIIRQSLDTLNNMATPEPSNSEIISILGEMNTKLQKLDVIETEVIDIKSKLARLEAKVDEIDKVVDRVDAMEHSVAYLSDCFDSWQTEKTEMQNELAGVKQKVEHFTPIIESLQHDNIKLREAAVDARCRSMHDNLIFTDIPEVEPIPSLVECEKVLKSFIENKLKIDPTNIRFKRVHRIGRPGSNPNRP